MESEKSGYISVTFSVAVILIAVYGYWPATLSIPWTYSGDALFTAITFQGMIDTGWILENPRLGMPFGHYFYDFPTVDLLHIFIIRGLTWAIPHWPICFNLFFMIGFFLTAWTTYWSSRQIGLKRYWALTTAILYTFLPYHYLRGQLHLFLTAYYTIPLVILLCLWIAMGKFSCASIKFRRSQVACFISLLMALSGIYYAFFSCFFVLVSGIVGFLKFRKRATLVVTILCISIICSGVFLQLIPNYWYYYHEGRNPTVAYRSSVESEHHGLKMIQLFMPVEGHRVRLLREFSDNYASSAPLVYENRVSSLGVLGSIGFILLLCCILLSNEKNKKCFSEKLFNIARLNLAAILLATIGGGGTLFALLVSPQIRAYNRISIFIALFSLWALFLVLQDAFHRYYNDKKCGKVLDCFRIDNLWDI
jgi:phosphoglycerol transferase